MKIVVLSRTLSGEMFWCIFDDEEKAEQYKSYLPSNWFVQQYRIV